LLAQTEDQREGDLTSFPALSCGQGSRADQWTWMNAPRLRYAFIMQGARLEDQKRFYKAVDALSAAVGSPRTLAACNARLGWPGRGVYFFMEDGEPRSHTGAGPRIVRVGTHALKTGSQTTLWKRLSQHRGQARSGSGNHRGSIFRLIVGTALIQKHGYEFPTWGDRRTSAPAEIRAAERVLECEVSKTLGAMRFLWLGVDDDAGPESKRGYIERNAIALLSNFGKEPIDPPSPSWLGHYCNRPRVKASGLWNANHVDEQYDPVFLDELERLVSETGGAR
jgi:hypothetical protein